MWQIVVVIATIVGLIADIIAITQFINGASSASFIGIEISRQGWAFINMFLGVVFVRLGLIFQEGGGPTLALALYAVGGVFVIAGFLLMNAIPGVRCLTANILIPIVFISIFLSKNTKDL